MEGQGLHLIGRLSEEGHGPELRTGGRVVFVQYLIDAHDRESVLKAVRVGHFQLGVDPKVCQSTGGGGIPLEVGEVEKGTVGQPEPGRR